MTKSIISLSLVLTPMLLHANPKGGIELIISVDWEAMGGNIKPWHEKGGIAPSTLQSFKTLRSTLPRTPDGRVAPMVQLLNPGFFTQPEYDHKVVSAQILSVLDPSDEFGLHIHTYKSLLDVAKISAEGKFHFSFYDSPHESADWDKKLKSDGTCEKSEICGYGIPLFNYKFDELRRLLQASKALFRKNGISQFFGDQDPTIFRASAGLYSRPLFLALLAEGIYKDTSAIPAYWQEAAKWDTPQTPVVSAYSVYLSASNGHLFEGGSYDELSTQFSRIKAETLGQGSGIDLNSSTARVLRGQVLTEYPINGAMVDNHFPEGSNQAHKPGTKEPMYIKHMVESMYNHYLKIANVYAKNKSKVHYLQFGVHFEFYPVYHKALPLALNRIFADAAKRGIPLQYAKLPLPR